MPVPEEETRPPAKPPTAGRTGFVYGFGRRVLAPLARAIYRPRVSGRENIPREGAVILASNHMSFIDSVVIPVASPRPVFFMAKSDYFDGKGIKGWVSRSFFTAFGASPVNRGGGQASVDALSVPRDLLRNGSAVALYPEGTRSRDGRLYRGRTGVAFLALETGAKVVPVGLKNTNLAMPVDAKIPRLRPRIEVHFGEPLELSHFGPASSGRARRLATDAIMAAIHELSGQELAAAYNEPPAESALDRIKQAFPHERR